MKGWKTILFNLFAAILPILEGFDITSVIDTPKAALWYGLAIAIGNAILRAFTKTAIFKSE